MFSVWNRHEATTKCLLDFGANVDCADAQGIIPLMKAAWQASPGCVRLLLEKGADANVHTGQGWVALHSAVHGGNCECVDLLLASGASCTAESIGMWLPLHEACQIGERLDIVAALLDASPETVNRVTSTDKTPLTLCLEASKDDSVLELLLARGADVNSRGARAPFLTPLYLAARSNNAKAARSLLAYGADPSAKVASLTPLQAALQLGFTDVALELLFA